MTTQLTEKQDIIKNILDNHYTPAFNYFLQLFDVLIESHRSRLEKVEQEKLHYVQGQIGQLRELKSLLNPPRSQFAKHDGAYN